MADLFVASSPTPKAETAEKPVAPPESHIHALASFCQHPNGIKFENQEKDEQILLILRGHFLTNLPWIALTLLLILLPPLLSFFVPSLISELLFFSTLPIQFIVILSIAYYAFVFTFAFVSFMTWFYNITFITTKRMVDVDYSDIIHHDIAITKLSNIEDIRYVQTGALRTFFNFGDVYAQTAGESENFEALAVPQPAYATELIGNLIGKGRHG